jgi:hypothetical protein
MDQQTEPRIDRLVAFAADPDNPVPELPLATVAFHPRTQWANGLQVWVTYRPDGRPVRASTRRPPLNAP